MLPTSPWQPCSSKLPGISDLELRPAYSKLRLQEAPPGCGPFLAAKNSNSHMVFQWIAQRILRQLFEEIIHIQGGIKELNTKMLLLILSELLTVRREFLFAFLVFRAW